MIGGDEKTKSLTWVKKRLGSFFTLYDNRLFIFSYLCCSIFFKQSIELLSVFSNVRLFEAIFWLPISNYDFLYDLIVEDFKVNSYAYDLLRYVVSTIPDPDLQEPAKIELERLFIISSKNLSKQEIDDAIKMAEKGSSSSLYDMHYGGKRLWGALVERGYGGQNAAKLAERLFLSSNKDQAFSGRRLWEELLKRGVGVDSAIELASKCFEVDLVSQKGEDEAFSLWSVLLREGYGVERAIYLKDKFQASQDSFIQDNLSSLNFNLFTTLREKVQQGQFIEESIDIVSKGIMDSDYYLRSNLLELWKELFEKGYGFEEATKIDNSELQELLRQYKPQKQEDLKKEASPAEVKAEEKIKEVEEPEEAARGVVLKPKVEKESKDIDIISKKVVEDIPAEQRTEEVKKIEVKELQEDVSRDELKKEQEKAEAEKEPKETGKLLPEVKAEEKIEEVEHQKKR